MNIGHRTVIVAGELDSETERIVNYLAETHGVPINARFFRLFRDGDREYLTRSWLIDPAAVEVKTEGKKRFGEWNGEYCGTFGGNEERRTLSRRFGPAEAARSG